MATPNLPSLTPEGNLSRYLQDIRKFPMLTHEEEFMLAQRWREHDDVDAAHKLVTSHLRLVAKIAMKYKGYGLPVADLVSEGNIGLMKAVKKFEPERGFRLSTYAMWWIRAAITEHILRSWSLVKMGTMAAQKKLFFSLRRVKGQLKILDQGELAPEEAAALSEALNVPAKDILSMNRRMASRDASLNAPVTHEETMEFQDTLVDDTPSPEALVADSEEMTQRRGLLSDALETLPDRERHILTERRLKDDPMTLEDLGKIYDISRERVRQLEVRAFEKISKEIQAAAADDAFHPQ